ncbi:MAG: filamentous hemagglutinin N-terminal domain-containing protein [Hyphomicrobiales bacterium]|nr:filamentous hemagglutinin N-terminal domain-containing protein [Hyphomicrobiales bacterium]
MTELELLCAGETPRPCHRRLLASLAASTALASATLLIAATTAQAGSPVAVPANMLPQGGHFVAGAGSIGTQGLTETITQTSQRGIIDFNSFSIGKSGTVKINNGTGATLNRVTGGNLSQIFGTLSATGSVYLVNPQGVVVGKSGVITTGGSFVASSLDISNQNFMAGQTLRFTGKSASDGVVKNLGSISSSGGDVFLIARSVVNSGSINAPNGTVGLGAGQEVLLKDMSVSGGRMTVRYGKGDVRNKGSIAAAQAELRAAGGNVYALAGNHSGMIRATGSAMRGGHVWLTAGGNRFVYAQSETLTVTPTGAATTTVTYDGATQKAASNPGNFTFTGFVGNDGTNPNAVTGTAGVTGGTGRNVGTYAFTADVSGLSSDFGYQFQAGTGGGLVITKAALTVSAVADMKVYDGTAASAGAVQVTGLQGPDTASFTQVFGSKNVQGANGSTLSASGLVNDGNGGGNYAITFANAAGTITKAALTVTELSDNKVFDGTTGSTVSAQVSGLKGTDSVSGLGESFVSANAGSRAMALGGLTVNDGNGGGNYSLTIVNATGTITPAQLTITANNATQVIGTPDPVFSASFGPFPAGLGPSALSGMLSFTTNAPAGSPGSFKIFASGVSSPNFDITFVPGTLLVTAANNSLPPVPFEMDQGNGTPAFSFTDPVLASLLVELSDAGGPAMKKNLGAPTLDQNGNPIGNLISFNSSFIEVCRTHANLCR